MKRSIWGICLTGFMALIIGVVGISGVMMVNENYHWSYEDNIESLTSISKVLEFTQKLKALPYMALNETDVSRFYERECAYVLNAFEMYMDEFAPYIINVEVRVAFDEMKIAYFDEYKPLLLEMLEYLKQDESRVKLSYYLDSMTVATNQMVDSTDYCMNFTAVNAHMDKDAAYYSARFMAMIIAALVFLAIILSVIFIIVVARYKGFKAPAYQNSYSRVAAPPVYAMYPVDPSNPSSPPHATHVLYPVMTAYQPPQTGEAQQYPK